METTLLPSDAAAVTGNEFLQSLPGSALCRSLGLLSGGVWRAQLNPFRWVGWSSSATATKFGADSPLQSLLSDTAIDWESRIYPPDLPVFRAAVRSAVTGKLHAEPVDYRVIVADGELIWLRQWLIEAEPPEEVGLGYVIGVIREVTEEKQLQGELVRAGETERRRIGQELHDDVCQVLTGITVLLRTLQQRLQSAQPDAAEELESINSEVQAGLERTRALAHGLLPAKSDFNSLQQAFRDLSLQVANRFNLQLFFQPRVPAPTYPPERLLHLYRIVQEASSNAFKHGRATRVDVTFDRREGWDVLAIQDNGSGLPSEITRDQGVGLDVMRHRAELLGGRLQVGNGPQGGALVQVYLPPSADL